MDLNFLSSPEGHDAFRLQFELSFFRQIVPDITDRAGLVNADGVSSNGVTDGVGKLTESSVFGEAEMEDLTAW